MALYYDAVHDISLQKKNYNESSGAGSPIHFLSFHGTEGEEHRSNLTNKWERKTLAIWILLAPR